jgi:hypothetical protein
LIKVLLTSLLLLTISSARENPFFPADGGQELPITSNQDRSVPPLKRATISLPDQARLIKKVTIEYQNLNGSIESKEIELKNSVDWHLPIFISQNYTESSNNEIKKEEIAPKKEKEYQKIASIKYATFFSYEKELKIVTEDKIIRNFLLVDPHRIVLDFKRDTTMESYTKLNKKNIFKKIRIGNHSGYYRAVIELDGLYTYSTKNTADGYTLILN